MHPFARVLREGDLEHGHFVCRAGFEVVVSSHFACADAIGFLSRGALPMEKMQAILPIVTQTQSPQPAIQANASRGASSDIPSTGGARDLVRVRICTDGNGLNVRTLLEC